MNANILYKKIRRTRISPQKCREKEKVKNAMKIFIERVQKEVLINPFG
jgi:hypothetical protein